MCEENSSNYFFHFTKRIKYLKEVLINKAFSPRYNCEKLNYIHSSFGNINNIYIYIDEMLL